MKITISEIPDEGLEVEVSDEIDAKSISLTRPVHGQLRFTLHNSELYVHGKFDTAVEVKCSRCLTIYPFEMNVPIDLVYRPATSIAKNDNVELHPDELDVGYYSGDEIRAEEILEEQVLLNMPMKPLCKSDCRGICASCGADLNTQECACRTDKRENVFSILKNLKKN